MPDISRADADALVAEKKEITATLVWRNWGSGYRLQDSVVLGTESGTILRLTGFVGRSNRSFALLYRNAPIRKYTAHSGHRNPDGTRIEGPHKHTWDDTFEGAVAYVPNDIRIGEPNEELIDFLKECNVTLSSPYRPNAFPFQLGQ